MRDLTWLTLFTIMSLGLFPCHGQNQSGEDSYNQARDAYQNALKSFQSKNYEEALSRFDRVLELGRTHADASLYWKAYAHYKMGQLNHAQLQLEQLFEGYPESGWMEDAHALETEILAATGETDLATGLNAPATAMMALMNLPWAEAAPIIDQMLDKDGDIRFKEQALFALTQFDHPDARSLLQKLAFDDESPLNKQALRFLALSPDANTSQMLKKHFQNTGDLDQKMEVLTAFMLSGEHHMLESVAKNEANSQLARQAIILLAAMGHLEVLTQLFDETKDLKRKKAILQSTAFSRDSRFLKQIIQDESNEALHHLAIQQLGIGGDCESLVELYQQNEAVALKTVCLEALFIAQKCNFLESIATTETIDDLRHKALQYLGIIGGDHIETLNQIYDDSSFPGDQRAVIKALFIQQHSSQLIAIYRRETNAELRKFILQMLSVIHNQQARDFLDEIKQP